MKSLKKEWRETIYRDWHKVEAAISQGDYVGSTRHATLIFESILKNLLRIHQTDLPRDVQIKYLNDIDDKSMLGQLIKFWKEFNITKILSEHLSKDPRNVSGVNFGHINEFRIGVSHDPPMAITRDQASYVAKSVEMLLDFWDIEYESLASILSRKLDNFSAELEKARVSGAAKAGEWATDQVQYYKILHLSERREDKEPIYWKYVNRLEKKIPVYDEVISFGFKQLAEVEQTLSHSYRSSGVIDIHLLSPFVKSLKFDDRGEKYVENSLQQLIHNSPHIATFDAFLIHNGLQKNHCDLALKVTRMVDHALLVVDFSSLLPDLIPLKSKPSGVLCKNGEEAIVNVEELDKGVFYIEKFNAENLVLRMDFNFGWG